ncbi:ribosome recycling factor [Candidatus Peregrinibacteria bacterium]|jgi:ribosome recycling factor|nr:ribosome recycling factor [Candidatus Peregrinibacteria bacterium]MBT7736164.1 ribosome recycling factor [Candidatus Peregrinibacteria bacterium]
MSVQDAISKAQQEFDKALSHLGDEFGRLQVGRANSSLVENVNIDVYGAIQPLKAVASISIPEPRTIQIQPWDKGNLAAIEKAIVGIGTGLNPINDGNFVRINIPPLTEDRRKELSKHVHKLAEDARIAVRNSRQEAHNHFKQLKTDNDITEDDLRDADKSLQEKVDDINKKIDEVAKGKEQDVMTV